MVAATPCGVRTRSCLPPPRTKFLTDSATRQNPGAKKKAITAIAHTLLKIAYQVLKTGQPYTDLGADLCTRRESPQQQHAYLERRLQKLHPGCTVTITISPPPGSPPPGTPAQAASPARPPRARTRRPPAARRPATPPTR